MSFIYPLVVVTLVYHLHLTESQNDTGDACVGGVSLNVTPGIINFTGVPSTNVTSNGSSLCSWNITSPSGRMAFRFLTFNIGIGEAKSFCDGTMVRVHNGARWLSFCGAAPMGVNYTCRGGVIRVQYVSDGTPQTTNPLFSLEYFTVPSFRRSLVRQLSFSQTQSTVSACRRPQAIGMVDDRDIVLEQSQYENNCDKTWTLTSPPGMAIQVETQGSIESERMCRYDNLTLWSPYCEEQHPLLQKACYRFGCLCGDLSTVPLYKSVCNKLNVRFISDYSVTSSGFRLSLTLIPDQRPSHRAVTARVDGSTFPCGRSRAYISSRITGGAEVFPHRYPWQAALFYNDGLVCGGSVIASRWILTAAHCVDSVRARSMLTVKLGRHNISNNNESGITASVSQIVMHCDYDHLTYNHDIALLKLDRELLFGDTILPVCLPDTEDLANGTVCQVVGWGSTREDIRNTVDILRVGEVTTISDQDCRSRLSSYVVTDNMLCAGSDRDSNRADACWGDSGGALITKVPAGCQAVQFGVVSWGLGCARRDSPGVYTRIYNYVNWIDLVTQGLIDRLNPNCHISDGP